MGYYIETKSPKNKAASIAAVAGAKLESEPFFDPTGQRVGVCVVDNGPFEAAAICYSEREKVDFTEPSDTRPKQWLSLPRSVAIDLCPRVEGALPPLQA